MIVYEEASPHLRAGECELAGRRVAVRAFPYWGEAGTPAFRFDPIDRRFIQRPADGSVLAGPPDPEAWRRALARSPASPVLVGPCSPAEEVRGAYRAAAEGALEAGRAVYLLDPWAVALPPAGGRACVAVFGWQPGEEPVEAIRASTGLGIPSGLLLPVVPGWTAEPAFLEDCAARAAAAGLKFLAPVAPVHDGQARREIVAARGDSEGFFERIHHLDWEEALSGPLRAARDAARRHGLAILPPRPIGSAEPHANAAAAARLEERAGSLDEDEHRASLLHAAARWIDESGRDLAVILSEGNFRKVFPFGPEIAREAEEAFYEGGP